MSYKNLKYQILNSKQEQTKGLWFRFGNAIGFGLWVLLKIYSGFGAWDLKFKRIGWVC